jgi:hypothetical protein
MEVPNRSCRASQGRKPLTSFNAYSSVLYEQSLVGCVCLFGDQAVAARHAHTRHRAKRPESGTGYRPVLRKPASRRVSTSPSHSINLRTPSSRCCSRKTCPTTAVEFLSRRFLSPKCHKFLGEKTVRLYPCRPVNGVSPSGKATDSDSVMRWFKSSHPSHFFLRFQSLTKMHNGYANFGIRYA